jgi:NitT/TauT family transport system ATP-binding protein
VAVSIAERSVQLPLVRASGLSYSYPSGLRVLNQVDLDLRPGEVISVIGPSGCGKSTLLSLMADLATPTAGSITWDESLLSETTRPGHRLAMVFQRDTVFPWRTVAKNLQFGMECLGLSKAERRTETETLLKLGKLQDFAKAYPGTLSGGMRRRLALLVGLSVHPRVLLLDEPFSALDEPTRIELLVDVLKLVYEYKVSVILVTHDLAEAISVSDRVVVMTQRPATVRRVVDIGFGHDRDLLTIRETPEYGVLYRDLWHELWSEIKSAEHGPSRFGGGAT